MEKQMEIRIKGIEDMPELIEFNKLCFPKDYWKEEDWADLLSDPRAVYYALMDGTRLVGDVFIYNWQGELDYVKIMNLSVHPDHRGRGLAHMLLDHVTKEYSKLGMERFCGETRSTNFAMQKVFEDCGYELDRVEEDYFGDPPGSAYKYVLRKPGKIPSGDMVVRFAEYGDLERVNELRRQVNELHVQGRPQTFKPGFPKELRDHVYKVFADPEQRIAVCEAEGEIRGFAVLNHVIRPETDYMFERDFIDIDEFCVDENYRRRGIATELIRFCADHARKLGFDRLELNMWEFNSDALAFYEAVGFTTYRRYMELQLRNEEDNEKERDR